MKKVFSILFVGGLLLTVASCFNDNSMSDPYVENEKAGIVRELEKINSELLADAPQERNSRGWNNWTTKQKAAVISADCAGCWKGGKLGAKLGAKVGAISGQPLTGGVFGAFLGGVVGGAFASWVASPDNCKTEDGQVADSLRTVSFNRISSACQNLVKKGEFARDKMEIDSILWSKVGKTLAVDPSDRVATQLGAGNLRVGMLHNALLSSLDGGVLPNGGVSFPDSIYTAPYPHSDIICCDDVLQNQKRIINYPGFMENCKLIGEQISTGSGESAGNPESTSDEVMELFREALENSSSEVDDVAFIVEKYVEALSTSTEIDDEEKEALKNAFATALYSSKYWENK